MSATSEQRLPLSVVIVAKHAEKQLPRALKSVRDWTDEVIVGLTDDDDNSAQVVREHGGIVCRREWIGYRDTKNAVAATTRNPWVLSLDSDEEVPPGLRAEIEAFMRNADASPYVVARFPRKTWFLNRWITHGDWYPDHCTRLYRKDRARWGGGAVHERLVWEGEVATLKTDLLHYSFDSIRHAVNKLLATADLAAKQQIEQGKAPPALAIITRPLWGFFRCYVVKRGFLDGVPGLIVACLAAVGRFTKYSRMYEAQRARPPE